MKIIREIIFYKHYFEEFFEPLSEKVKNKIDEVLFMITIVDRVPKNSSTRWMELKDYLKFELNMKVTFTEYSAVLTKEI